MSEEKSMKELRAELGISSENRSENRAEIDAQARPTSEMTDEKKIEGRLFCVTCRREAKWCSKYCIHDERNPQDLLVAFTPDELRARDEALLREGFEAARQYKANPTGMDVRYQYYKIDDYLKEREK